MNNKHNQNTGKIGEETACKFLMKHGYQIITRNYWKKWGEIDIIAKKNTTVHFVEVKTVSRILRTGNCVDLSLKNGGNTTAVVSCESGREVSYETNDGYRPEDNIHPWKLKRLSRVIQTYLIENEIGKDNDWQFDAITVFLDTKNKLAKVEHIKDIIL